MNGGELAVTIIGATGVNNELLGEAVEYRKFAVCWMSCEMQIDTEKGL